MQFSRHEKNFNNSLTQPDGKHNYFSLYNINQFE